MFFFQNGIMIEIDCAIHCTLQILVTYGAVIRSSDSPFSHLLSFWCVCKEEQNEVIILTCAGVHQMDQK